MIMDFMGLQNRKSLQLHQISYSVGDCDLLKNISATLHSGDRIALFGINGSGKSTLLKIVTGAISNYQGSIFTDGIVRYVPQIDLETYNKKSTVHEYISQYHEDWWDVILRLQQHFQVEFDQNKILFTLSGGEIVKLNLCIALAVNPDFLLMDEPTNHLDIKSLRQLIQIIENYDGGIILVSHNRYVLNKVTRETWELKDGIIKSYGGNYNFYQDQKRLEEEAALRQYENQKKELLKAGKACQMENIHFQESQAKLARMAREDDRSIPKIIRNSLKLKGQTTHGEKKMANKKLLDNIEIKLHTLKPILRKNVHFKLKANDETGLIIKVEDGALNFPSGRVLLSDINFELYFKDRIVLTGNNGSGKTTFIKAIAGVNFNNSIVKGTVKHGNMHPNFVFVDQKYNIVDPILSLLENISTSNPAMDNESIRRYLSDLGFHNENVIRRTASTLSGGEIARLAIAIAVSRITNVLVLDEPTNNLDIETVNTVTRAIKDYKGTIVVVSHDVTFLKEIGIINGYKIDRKVLMRMDSTPQNEDEFIKETVNLM